MKTKNLLKSIAVFSLLLFLFAPITSCTEDEDDYYEEEMPQDEEPQFSGTVEDIQYLLGDAIYDSIISSGYQIHTGSTPPNVNGRYVISEARLKKSTVEGDYPNQYFQDYYITYDNFNLANLLVDYQGDQGNQHDEGDGIFICGSGNKFTSILLTTTTYYYETAESAILITGTLTDNGIEDCEFMYIMVENYGSSTWIPNGTYRIIYDVDGLASEI